MPSRPIPVRPTPKEPPGSHFPRAAFLMARAAVENRSIADMVANDPVAPLIINRAAVDPATATASSWSEELAANSFGAFLADLSVYAAAPRLIELAQKVELHNRGFESTFPFRTDGRASLQWVSEGSPIPVRADAFTNVAIGPPKKVGSIIPFSREIGRTNGAAQLFALMLREDIAATLDAVVFSTAAATDAGNAGLLHGVTAGVGYGGGDAIAMRTDLMNLADVVSAGGSGNVSFAVSPKRLARLRLLDPVLAAAIDISASAAIPEDRIVAADGPALVFSVDRAPEIVTSNVGTVHMNTSPAEIVSGTGPATAAPVRELWQTATHATRVLYELAFEKRRATAVAYTDGATW